MLKETNIGATFSVSNRLCGSPLVKASTVQCTAPPTSGTESEFSSTLLITMERLVSTSHYQQLFNQLLMSVCFQKVSLTHWEYLCSKQAGQRDSLLNSVFVSVRCCSRKASHSISAMQNKSFIGLFTSHVFIICAQVWDLIFF